MKTAEADVKGTATAAHPTHCCHCHDPLPTKPVLADDRAFCCSGCQVVYDLIHDSGLENFYRLDPKAGRKVDAAARRWDYLDLPEVQAALLAFDDGTSARMSVRLPAIHCSACIWLLENLHRVNAAVKHVSVNFPKKEASIFWNRADLAVKDLAILLESLGYPPEVSLDPEKSASPKQRVNKSLVLRLGVAGFCFGNIMLLSLPEYLDSTAELPADFRQYFQYISIGLSLPVFFYSSTVFFKAAWQGLRHRLVNMDVPIAIGILILFLRSGYEIVSQTGPGYLDSLAGLVFFLLIGRWYQSKTYAALNFERDYKSYFPVAVTRLQGEQEETVLLEKLEKGDRVLIRSGELIPADCTLVDGEGKLDYSFVTGESDPQHKSTGSELFAGGRHLGAPITVRLEKPVAQSYLTQLWNEKNTPHDAGLTTQLANVVSRWFTAAIFLLATGTLIYWYVVDVAVAWNAVSAVLIVACPCALALSIPFTYGTAQRYLGKHGLYLKNADVIERMATLTRLVFDKTGTITHKESSNVQDHLRPLSEEERRHLAALSRCSTHPLSQRLHRHMSQQLAQDPLPQVQHFEELTGRGIRGTVGGHAYTIGSAAFVGAGASPESRLWLRRNEELLGYVAFENNYRPGLFSMLKQLSSRYRLHMISGDSPEEQSVLQPHFASVAFSQSPQAKLDYINELKSSEQGVMMVGDGLNDAGALGASDVGVSISDDVHQFTPASSAILAARTFGQLPQLLAFARHSRLVVYGAFALSFLYNIVGISYAASGNLTPLTSAILMPLSSVTVVAYCSLLVRWLSGRLASKKQN